MVTVWPLLPAGMVAAVMAYLSSGVKWIAQFGVFGLFATGLVSFLTYSVAYALLGRGRLWRANAGSLAKLSGGSSEFDPMARVYEGKRLFLRDLAPLGRRQVHDKKFIDCEIIGPGTAVIGLRSAESKPWPKMDRSNTFDVDCVEIDPATSSQLAVSFIDCDFEGCNFYHMTLLFTSRTNHTLSWITPDFRQALLPPPGESD